MSLESVIALIAATSVLVAIPGPNVALIAANTLRYGRRVGITTVFGTTMGIAVQLVLVVTGLAALISLAASAMVWIKWAGVAYLMYLGIKTWLEDAGDPDDLRDLGPSDGVAATAFWQGFFIALINPKILLMNAAFLPQFASPAAGSVELALLAAVYLTVLLAGDLIWALCAERARYLVHRFEKFRNRITGGIFAVAGAGLALARVDR